MRIVRKRKDNIFDLKNINAIVKYFIKNLLLTKHLMKSFFEHNFDNIRGEMFSIANNEIKNTLNVTIFTNKNTQYYIKKSDNVLK